VQGMDGRLEGRGWMEGVGWKGDGWEGLDGRGWMGGVGWKGMDGRGWMAGGVGGGAACDTDRCERFGL